MTSERSPGWKLFFAGIIGIVLVIPLMIVYALVWDRQEQSNVAQNAIAAGWGGPQVVVGPVLVIPYTVNSVETVDENGRQTTRTLQLTKELFLSPETNTLSTNLKPDRKKKSIYESVLFVAENSGTARFALPADFARYGIARDTLNLAGLNCALEFPMRAGFRPIVKSSSTALRLNCNPAKDWRRRAVLASSHLWIGMPQARWR
jgi:inner membrane protein